MKKYIALFNDQTLHYFNSKNICSNYYLNWSKHTLDAYKLNLIKVLIQKHMCKNNW